MGPPYSIVERFPVSLVSGLFWGFGSESGPNLVPAVVLLVPCIVWFGFVDGTTWDHLGPLGTGTISGPSGRKWSQLGPSWSHAWVWFGLVWFGSFIKKGPPRSTWDHTLKRH